MSFEEGKRLPAGFATAVLGVLVAVIAVAPLYVVVLLGRRPGSWFRTHSFPAALAAQGFNMVWLFGCVLACAFVAKPQLMRFSLFAGVTMLLLQTLSAFIWLRRRRRKAQGRGDKRS